MGNGAIKVGNRGSSLLMERSHKMRLNVVGVGTGQPFTQNMQVGAA
jgi:hypothetical protein